MATVMMPSEVVVLPDDTQLPESDGTFGKNFQEHPQSMLLTDCLQPRLGQVFPHGQYCLGQNSGIYWRLTDPPERGVVAPNWFLVPDVPPTLAGRVRRSYVWWQELMAPLIILEFVSGDGSEERDTTPWEGKFWIYERVIRPAFYGIYEVNPGRIELYHLVAGKLQLVPANERGHYPVPPLGVELGIWEGTYQELQLPWLRWWDDQGLLFPTGHEQAAEERQRADEVRRRADEEHQRAEEECHRAEEERRRAERLAQRLRALGIDPDEARE